MKNLINKNYRILILLMFALITWSSCRNTSDSVLATAPSIDMVAASVDINGVAINPLVSTHLGFANNTYIITGKGFASLKHVYFNDFESFFNTTLVTDNTIIITINRDTPYINGNNKLKLVTGTGTVLYDFVIAPPAPVFKGFQSINASDGSNISLKGNFFVNPVVTIGTTKATVVSSDLTHIVVTLPPGSQGQKVTVTTLSGAITYTSQIGTSFYDDVFYGGVTAHTWGGASEKLDIAYSADPLNIQQGDNAIQYNGNPYSAMQCDGSPAIPSTAKGVRFYVKATVAGTGNLQIILNYNGGAAPLRDLSTDYQYYEIPWSAFGLSAAPYNMNLTYKNNSGNPNTMYFDDIGYYK